MYSGWLLEHQAIITNENVSFRNEIFIRLIRKAHLHFQKELPRLARLQKNDVLVFVKLKF